MYEPLFSALGRPVQVITILRTGASMDVLRCTLTFPVSNKYGKTDAGYHMQVRILMMMYLESDLTDN